MRMRSLVPVLVLLGMSFFLFDRAGRSEVGYTLDDLHVVEGVVAHHEVARGSFGTGSRPAPVITHAVTLEGRPQNLAFHIATLDDRGIAPGSRVRLEVLDDPGESFARAASYPEARYGVDVEGAAVDGRVVYSAAEAVERSTAAATTNRLGGLGCLVAGVAWAGVLVRSRWGAIRSFLDRL